MCHKVTNNISHKPWTSLCKMGINNGTENYPLLEKNDVKCL